MKHIVVDESVWQKKGATLSENSVSKEYGLTHEELAVAVACRKIHCCINYAHGNPYNRFIRSEIEALVKTKRGSNILKESKIKTELAQIETRLRSMRIEKTKLEKRKAELLATLEK